VTTVRAVSAASSGVSGAMFSGAVCAVRSVSGSASCGVSASGSTAGVSAGSAVCGAAAAAGMISAVGRVGGVTAGLRP